MKKLICSLLTIVFLIVFTGVAISYDISVAISKDMPQGPAFPGKNTLMKLELTNTKDIDYIVFKFRVEDTEEADSQSPLTLKSLEIRDVSSTDEAGRRILPGWAGSEIGTIEEYDLKNPVAKWYNFKSGVHQITLEGNVQIMEHIPGGGNIPAKPGTPILVTTKLTKIFAMGTSGAGSLSVQEGNLPLTAQIGKTVTAPARQELVFQIKQQEVKQGEGVSVFAQDKEGKGISAFDMILSFEGDAAPKLTEPLAGWYIESSSSQGGKQLRVIGVGMPAILQERCLFKLVFNAPGTVKIDFKKAEINGSLIEGGEDILSQSQAKGGAVKILPIMSLEAFLVEKELIYPNPQGNNPVIKVGEPLFLTVKGGTPPYCWAEPKAYFSNNTRKVYFTWPPVTPLSFKEPALTWEKVILIPFSGWMHTYQTDIVSESVNVELAVIDSHGLSCSLIVGVFPLYGDSDGNGKVETADAVWIINSLLAGKPFSLSEKYAADVNGNKIVSTIDALLILQYVAGIITSFPVEAQGKPAPSKQPFSFEKNIARLKMSKEIEPGVIELLLQARQYELARRLPTTWGAVKSAP